MLKMRYRHIARNTETEGNYFHAPVCESRLEFFNSSALNIYKSFIVPKNLVGFSGFFMSNFESWGSCTLTKHQFLPRKNDLSA